ncbi:MAG: SAV_6107 family HEPN domain-containing protein, partial [Actinomycetes bacterium]
RAAAEAGLARVVTTREADDLVREAEIFLALVESMLGLAHQPALAGCCRSDLEVVRCSRICTSSPGAPCVTVSPTRRRSSSVLPRTGWTCSR